MRLAPTFTLLLVTFVATTAWPISPAGCDHATPAPVIADDTGSNEVEFPDAHCHSRDYANGGLHPSGLAPVPTDCGNFAVSDPTENAIRAPPDTGARHLL